MNYTLLTLIIQQLEEGFLHKAWEMPFSYTAIFQEGGILRHSFLQSMPHWLNPTILCSHVSKSDFNHPSHFV